MQFPLSYTKERFDTPLSLFTNYSRLLRSKAYIYYLDSTKGTYYNIILLNHIIVHIRKRLTNMYLKHIEIKYTANKIESVYLKKKNVKELNKIPIISNINLVQFLNKMSGQEIIKPQN